MTERFTEMWPIVATIDPQVAGQTTATTDVIDMYDVREVAFIISAGAIEASGTFDFTVNSGTATGTVTTSVTSITTLGATDDNKQAVVSIRPEFLTEGHRYIAGVLTTAAGNGTGSVVAVAKAVYRPGAESLPDLASVAEIINHTG